MSAASRVRVLQVIPDLGGGGAERMLLHLATHLDPTKYAVEVLSLYGKRHSAVEAELAAAAIPVVYLAKRVGFDPAMFSRIGGVVGRVRPHIVHTHRAVLQYAMPALMFSRCRVVHTVHNLATLELPRAGRLAHGMAFRLGVAPVAIGNVVAETFETVYGRKPRATIRNGIPVGAYASPKECRARWRAREDVSPDRFVFVCAARLEPQKNMPLLIRAFRSMVEQLGARPMLLVAGDGPLRRDLEGMVRDLGLREHVRFLGSRSDIPDLLGASDAFALSSSWEGNPLAVMEAMAAGLAVVGTRVGGVPEIVVDGVTGILTNPSDDKAFASAMVAVVKDTASRKRMSVAARVRAYREFDVTVMARRYDELYGELLEMR